MKGASLAPKAQKRSPYGWGMVEGTDYVCQLPETVIESLTEDDVKKIKNQKFRNGNLAIINVAKAINEQDPQAFRNDFNGFARDLIDPLLRAGDNVQKKNHLSEPEKQILTRFQLACVRLKWGKNAYEEPEKYLSDDLRNSEKAAPMTFDPGEFIPEL